MQSSNIPLFTRPSRMTAKLLATILCTTSIASYTHADSGDWTGLGANNLWSNSDNWTGGSPPATFGQTATFNGNGNGQTTIDLGTGISASNIAFDTASAVSYTIGAGSAGSQTLSLNTNIAMDATVAADQFISSNVLLNGTSSKNYYNNSTTNSLNFTGGIFANTAETSLTFSGSGVTNVSGNITDGTGSLALVKNQGGTLNLTGTNSFTGSINITNGSIDVSGGSTSSGVISYTGPNSNVIVSGGSLTTTGITTNGTSSSRSLALNGGTLIATGDVFATDAANVVTIDGGSLKSGNAAGITVFDHNNSIAIGSGGATFDTTEGDITIGNNAVLDGTSTLTFIGGTGTTFTADTISLTDGTPLGFDLTNVAIDNAVALVTLTTLDEVTDGGTYNVDFGGFEFSVAGIYELISFDTVSGTLLESDFAAINAQLASGYTADFVLDGSSLSFSVIPEPSTFAAISGLLVLCVVSIRRRR